MFRDFFHSSRAGQATVLRDRLSLIRRDVWAADFVWGDSTSGPSANLSN